MSRLRKTRITSKKTQKKKRGIPENLAEPLLLNEASINVYC